MQVTCDAPEKHNFSPFAFTMTVAALPGHVGITSVGHETQLSVIHATSGHSQGLSSCHNLLTHHQISSASRAETAHSPPDQQMIAGSSQHPDF